MHYKNGREAKNGDKVVVIPSCGSPYTGILYDATAGNDFCNGRVAPISAGDPMPNLQEVLHIEDAMTALGDISKVPDLTKPSEKAPDADAGATA